VAGKPTGGRSGERGGAVNSMDGEAAAEQAGVSLAARTREEAGDQGDGPALLLQRARQGTCHVGGAAVRKKRRPMSTRG
jgi:hypothetical protein